MAVGSIIICLLALLSYSSAQPSPPPPRGCSVDVDAPYRVLCDLESVWGVVLEAVACSGGITSLVVSVFMLVKLRSISDPARRSGLGPLLLLLTTLLGLFTISLAFLVGKNQWLCVVRRAFWGPLFALCFSSLVVQGVRLRRLVAGRTSPSGSTLAALGLALALVQGIISAEWVLLTVIREGHPACEYPPLDFALICSYTLGLLLIAMGLSLGVVLCGGELGADGGGSDDDRESESEKRRWKCNAVWLFLSCLTSALLWVAWLGFYLYGSQLKAKAKAERSGKAESKDMRVLDEPALAVALVIQGWILLLFHAIPEVHLSLRTPQESNTQDYYETSKTNPSSHFEETSHSHRPFAVEEQSETLRSGTYHSSSHGSVRPGIAFRGHVYQPTEMALVMNGGTTDSDEDVIFVRERPGKKVPEIPFDWGKLQVLQREIDDESLPYQTPTSDSIGSLRSFHAKGLMENMKMTINEETKTDFVKKVKKQKKDKIPVIKMESKIKTEIMLGEMSKKEMKKKRRIVSTTAETDDADPEAEEVYKKKKKLVDNIRQTETADLLLVEETVKEKKKRKSKSKSMQTESNVEIVKIEKVENNVMDNLQEEKSKSKKAKKAKEIVVTEIQTIKKDKKKKTKQLAEEDISIIESGTKKKKKSKPAEQEIQIKCCESDQIKNVKVKKKEKKDKSRAEKNEEKTHKMKDNFSKNAKEETKEKDFIQLKKKKNKKSEREIETVVDSKKCKKAQDIVDVTDKPVPKKKKKKKTQEENVKETLLLLDSESDAMSEDKQKKRPKKGGDKIDTETDGPKKKKNKIKKEQLDPEEPSQVEVMFLSEKTGNTDEVNINTARRQALQMEIDQASQPQKTAKPLGLGQWGTAEFGSSEQQQKFLRLMGGFKKGFQPASSSGGGGNMALGREAQQQLQQGLLGQFEHAQSRRMDSSNRGAGLGFTASSKKFSIDANVTRSIRFDD